jgi:triacylglycerol esterase/lipase EstA (alpha/beta hydrolase family)
MLPTVLLPGYFASADEYQDLAQVLTNLGSVTAIVPLKKLDWLPTVGGKSMMPILRKLDATVKQVQAQYSSPQINLLGHSAGGWIARIYLGDVPYAIHGDVTATESLWQGHTFVSNLVTLGTPHISQEPWTRKNLDFVNNNYPGAFYAQVKYICVAGKAISGEQRWRNWLAFNSYQITCGEGNTWGDGITPIVAAHLEGAINLTIPEVFHSPRSKGLWYGSPEIIPQWKSYLR